MNLKFNEGEHTLPKLKAVPETISIERLVFLRVQ
jgi:hypothetical protein